MHRSLSEIIRFGMVGALATALHYGIYFLLWRYAGFNENIAYTVGYALSFVANFYLSAYFTFRSRPSWKRAGGFGGAHLVNYLLHICLLNLFLWLGIPEEWAPLPVFSIAIPVNFLLVRLVFKSRRK
ncbi:MAG TPA: polysaccharide biosynthesis protein GtrA [Bacteroides sp.]|nr:GtrA family protein [Phocaeicola coprophilus]HBB06717.1 polysaccharide biosynthesis protein GtrA [Bacteroides sp.]